MSRGIQGMARGGVPGAVGGMGVHRAVAEHPDAVVAVVPALLHDEQRAAHRLADADRHRALDPREAVDQGARRQLLQHLGLGGLTRRHDRGVGEPLRIVQGAVADAEMVDRDEDPAALGVPGGLGPGSRARQVLGVVAPGVPAAGLAEADQGIDPELVGDGDGERDVRRLTQAGRFGDVDPELHVRPMASVTPFAYLGAKCCPPSSRMHEPLSIGVLDDGHGESGVLLGPAHALGEGGVLGEGVGELVGDPLGDARC